jgi:hypothetical protein
VKEKWTANPEEGGSAPEYKQEYSVEHRLSGAWLRSCGSREFKEYSQGVPPLVSMHALQETGRFGDATFFLHARQEFFATISFDTSFQSCRNLWICRLGLIYLSSVRVGDPPRFVLSVREFFNNVFPRQRTRWTNSMACRNHLHFSSLEKTSEVYSLQYGSR